MNEDDLAGQAEPPSHYTGFVLDAYAAAFDRVPSAGEVAGQCAVLEAGLSHGEFLSSLLGSEERQAVVAARAELLSREPVTADQRSRFIGLTYRAVFGREPDEDGFATHSAGLAGGMSQGDFLAMLLDSEEAVAHRAKFARPTFDMAKFVRVTFDAILHRPPEESAVAFFADALVETMDLEGFVNGLANSPEGRNVRGQQGAGPLNAACVSLTLFLESQLRGRGMVLDLGPPPAATMSAQAAEKLLKKLARTIEMMSTLPTTA